MQNKNRLTAFHGSELVKDAVLAQLQGHYEADEIVKGVYWESGKGCAVGCTVHSGAHASYETQFGIPQLLARLEDGIFEAMDYAVAREWPLRFMRAVPVGADLSEIWPQFAVKLLTDPEHGVINLVRVPKFADIAKSIQAISDYYAAASSEREGACRSRSPARFLLLGEGRGPSVGTSAQRSESKLRSRERF